MLHQPRKSVCLQAQSSEADDWETVAEGMTTPSAAKAAAFKASTADSSTTNKKCGSITTHARPQLTRLPLSVLQWCSVGTDKGPVLIPYCIGSMLPGP